MSSKQSFEMSFFYFFFLFIFLHYSYLTAKIESALFYTGIIELHIRPDRRSLQGDLSLLKQYMKEKKDSADNPTTITKASTQRNGLGLYKKNESDSDFENLYYVLAEKVLTESLKGIEGIHGFYRGYDTASDTQGRILFPRLDNQDEISILLTSKVSPIILKGEVPDHFIVGQDIPYTFYRCTGKKNEKNDTTTWTIEIRNDKNLTQKIPFNTLVILVNPYNAYFETTETIIQTSNNILLPTLCLIDNKEQNTYSTFALDVLRYYKPFIKFEQTTSIANQIHDNSRLKDYIN
jgi:hypothetical protein